MSSLLPRLFSPLRMDGAGKSVLLMPSLSSLPSLISTRQCSYSTPLPSRSPSASSPIATTISGRRPFSTSNMRSSNKTIGQLKARHSTGPFSWKAAVLLVITGASMLVYFRYERARLERKRITEMSKGIGRPKVGGPFVLKDLNGRVFTEEDLKGKYNFVGFPFFLVQL
jgi:protein SCO1